VEVDEVAVMTATAEQLGAYRLSAERERLIGDLLAALDGYRKAKARFVARTAYYQRRYPDPVTAEFQAAADHQRKGAIADCDWFQREVMTAGIALLALRGAS